MRRFLLLLITFTALVALNVVAVNYLRQRERITIPSSWQTIKTFASPIVMLPGPLEMPRSLAVNVLGLAHVAPDGIVLYVNKAREQAGLKRLTVDSRLTKAAKMRAETILKHENFSHIDPYDNIQLDTVIPKVGYSFSYISENIGLGEQDAESFVNGFLSSLAHKQNLLDAKLVDTGVGVASGKFKDREVTIVVQVFGVPAPVYVARGYPETEEANLKMILAGLNENLSRTNGYLTANPTSTYYLGWRSLLSRQLEIVRSVLSVVERKEPYTERERLLITEYNRNWTQTPR